MRLLGGTILILFLLFVEPLPAQNRQRSFSVFSTLTTNSKVFHHAKDPDPEIRNQFFAISDVWGFGIDLRIPLPDPKFEIGFSVEYLFARLDDINLTDNSGGYIVSDGYFSLPAEMTGYFDLPLGIHPLRGYIGGGIGIYLGGRTIEVNGVKSRIEKLIPSSGIHVLTGFEYPPSELFTVRMEIKFRNVEFSSRNGQIASEEGSPLPFIIDSSDSRVSLDGLTLALGVALRW